MKYYTPRFLFRRYQVLKRIKKGNHFLEIGPGSLNLTEDLLKHYTQGTLVEYNTYVQKIYNGLEKSIRKRLHLVIEDFMRFTSDSKYDCIIACEVMEHVEHDLVFLRKIHTLLNDRGQAIISVPARRKYWAMDDEIVGHYRRYEEKEINEMLLQEKFKDISIISYGFPFINILRWPRIILANAQAKNGMNLSIETRSKHSGISPVRRVLKLFGFLLNKYTVYPLCLISSLFNGYNLSDGYIITAEK